MALGEHRAPGREHTGRFKDSRGSCSHVLQLGWKLLNLQLDYNHFMREMWPRPKDLGDRRICLSAYTNENAMIQS